MASAAAAAWQMLPPACLLFIRLPVEDTVQEPGYQWEEERPAALADLHAAVQAFLWGDGGRAACRGLTPASN